MPLQPNNVGEGIMFLGCLVIPYVCLFVRSDTVTTTSHERLEQF